MPSRKARPTAVSLPRGVLKITARGRDYFYFQAGRNTPRAGPRIALPNDPHSPEFWQAIRQAQGLIGAVRTDTINALIDAYMTSSAFTLPPENGGLSAGTRDIYRRGFAIARDAWGELPRDGLRPVHVQAAVDKLAATPAKANNFLTSMRVLSRFGRKQDLIAHGFVEGVTAIDVSDRGHKPWTPGQIAAIDKLTAGVRRGVFLAMYTGQRVSDIIRLGFTDIDHGPHGDGFTLRQRKTGVEPWCPILPVLAAEMATWERQPGPFVRQDNGAPYASSGTYWAAFNRQRATIPELHGVTFHGLRATAVIWLRQNGFSVSQIVDAIGMSAAMTERYARFADRKAGGQAILLSLKERAPNKTAKHWKTAKLTS